MGNLDPFWKREEEIDGVKKDCDYKGKKEQLDRGKHPLRQTYPPSFTPEKQPKEKVHGVTICLSSSGALRHR